MVERRSGEMTRQHWPVLVLTAIGIAGASWPRAQSPLFVWNVSRSVPVGLYVIIPRPPLRGEFAALRLPEPMSGLADARGYLPARAVLIKPVVALAPDIVCRSGVSITINGQFAARASLADKSGRPLPQWDGCHHIRDQQYFTLSDEQHSLDGRYFGLVDERLIIGIAVSTRLNAIASAAISK